MTPAELAEAVRAAVRAAVDSGQLPLPVEAIPTEVKVERPKVKEHGDYATNIALQLAKAAGMPPREVAEAARRASWPRPAGIKQRRRRRSRLPQHHPRRGRAGRAGPHDRRRRRAAYGTTDTLAGQRINLEFVSANPTGPVHIGGTRWAAVGDALGPDPPGAAAPTVTREYYFNDHGAQIDRFARSLLAAREGPAGARGRLRRRLHRRHRRPGAGRVEPGASLDAAGRRGAGGLPGARAST